jgi:hypothetical protein
MKKNSFYKYLNHEMYDEDERRKKMTTFTTEELMEVLKKTFLWWLAGSFEQEHINDEEQSSKWLWHERNAGT